MNDVFSVRHSARIPATFGKGMRSGLAFHDASEVARKGYHRDGGSWTVRDSANTVVASYAPPMWRLGPRVPAQDGITGSRAWTAYTRVIGTHLYRFVRHTSLWDGSSVGIDVYRFTGEPNMISNPPERHFHFGATFPKRTF